MLKKLLLTSTTLLLMSGCVTKEIIYRPISQPYIDTSKDKSIEKIKSFENHNKLLSFSLNPNLKVGEFLNINAVPTIDGYLKIISINPKGKRELILPNRFRGSRLEAGEILSSNSSNFSLKTTKPTGLHHILVIFTQENPRLIIQQGMRINYNAIDNDEDLYYLLKQIKNGIYGKSYISLFDVKIDY